MNRYTNVPQSYASMQNALPVFLPVQQDAAYTSDLARVVLSGSYGGQGYSALSAYSQSPVPSGKGYFQLGDAYGCARRSRLESFTLPQRR